MVSDMHSTIAWTLIKQQVHYLSFPQSHVSHKLIEVEFREGYPIYWPFVNCFYSHLLFANKKLLHIDTHPNGPTLYTCSLWHHNRVLPQLPVFLGQRLWCGPLRSSHPCKAYFPEWNPDIWRSDIFMAYEYIQPQRSDAVRFLHRRAFPRWTNRARPFYGEVCNELHICNDLDWDMHISYPLLLSLVQNICLSSMCLHGFGYLFRYSALAYYCLARAAHIM